MPGVYEIASEHVDRFAALHPNAATSMGVPGHDHELTDFSPEGEERRAGLVRETLAALEAAPIEGDRDRVAAAAMLERLRLDVELHERGEQYRSLNIIFSPLQSLRRVFDLMPREGDEAWRTIAARLAAMPTAVEQYGRTLVAGVERGLTAGRRQAVACAKQCETYARGADGAPPFFRSLAEGYTGDDEALRVELDTGAAAAGEAFTEFARYLREQYAPSATPVDAVGAERYALGARLFNGAELDLEETYGWGWEELARVEREIAETAERILPGAGVEEAKRLLETDPARAIEGEEAFQRWMQELQDSTIAELHGRHFDIAAPVRTIEARIAPPGGALAMYYTGPSEDFSRPGRTWYPTGGKTRFPLWGEVSIAYHEGVPGHHLQIGQTTYLAETLSRWQRLMGSISGYVEGWALYAERLMAELGYLDVPDYYLGMLRAQALRCCRVIVDIGMHLELAIPEGARFHDGERWTPQLAQRFLEERSHFDADFLASEVDRYLGMPGQAISYKVGEREWLAAREAARRRDGAAFNLKAFHARALDLGPMGLAQMREELGGG